MTKPSQAPPAAPSWAIRAWTYPRTWPPQDIYVELASGLITKHPFTEGALTKVLKLIMTESKNAPPLNGKRETKEPVPVKRIARGKVIKPATDLPQSQVDAASNFLKKTGRL